MTRSPSRSLIPVALFSTLALAPAPARAGSFPYWGVSFGTPQRPAITLGASFGRDIPTEAEGVAIGSGPVVEVALGMGAGKIGVGKSMLVLTEEKSLRVHADVMAVATRTWDKPRAASVHATYLGVEGGLSVAFVRFTLGVAKRLEDKSRGANVLFTWGAGVQIRLGKTKTKVSI